MYRKQKSNVFMYILILLMVGILIVTLSVDSDFLKKEFSSRFGEKTTTIELTLEDFKTTNEQFDYFYENKEDNLNIIVDLNGEDVSENRIGFETLGENIKISYLVDKDTYMFGLFIEYKFSYVPLVIINDPFDAWVMNSISFDILSPTALISFDLTNHYSYQSVSIDSDSITFDAYLYRAEV